jgi:cytochrome c biogenesis protein ResB
MLVSPSVDDQYIFKCLQCSNIRGLTAALQGRDKLGDRYVRMPWYWRLSLEETAYTAAQVPTSRADLNIEYEESKSSRAQRNRIAVNEPISHVGVQAEWF